MRGESIGASWILKANLYYQYRILLPREGRKEVFDSLRYGKEKRREVPRKRPR